MVWHNNTNRHVYVRTVIEIEIRAFKRKYCSIMGTTIKRDTSILRSFDSNLSLAIDEYRAGERIIKKNKMVTFL